MRGLAALAVVIVHAINVSTPIPKLLDYTPLHILWGGTEAVIFFFVLSGFVLSLPYFSDKQSTYFSYMIKRVFRIYIPYVLAMLVAFILCEMTSKGGIAGLGIWFNEKWTNPITYDVVLQHVMLLGDFATTDFNPVIWSLVHEMRISLIFPLIVLMVSRLNWKKNISVAFALSAISFGENLVNVEQQFGYRTGFIDSLHFASMFIVGATLAKHKQDIAGLYGKLKRSHVTWLLASAVLLFTYSRGVLILPISGDALQVIIDWGTLVAVAIVMMIALSSKTAVKLLNHKYLLFNGKVSYSLYLWHAIVLFTMFNVLYGALPIWMIYIISLLVIAITTVAAYYFIEKPAMKLGKLLSDHSLNRNLARKIAVDK